MYLSGHPKSKEEAARLIRLGIELTVVDPSTNLPIDAKHGVVVVAEFGWSGKVLLRDGLVVKLMH